MLYCCWKKKQNPLDLNLPCSAQVVSLADIRSWKYFSLGLFMSLVQFLLT